MPNEKRISEKETTRHALTKKAGQYCKLQELRISVSPEKRQACVVFFDRATQALGCPKTCSFAQHAASPA
jgi:hypothetical protein